MSSHTCRDPGIAVEPLQHSALELFRHGFMSDIVCSSRNLSERYTRSVAPLNRLEMNLECDGLGPVNEQHRSLGLNDAFDGRYLVRRATFIVGSMGSNYRGPATPLRMQSVSLELRSIFTQPFQ